ncbi:MAG: hypothetical protein K6F07_02520 [Bacilli bacterium]|nr:hypothetical protein [Bacilli bacterium]
MSYKISFILSMIFVSMFFFFAGDVISIQFAYSSLDSKSITISHLISKEETLSETFKKNIEEKFLVTFKVLNEEEPYFGDVVDFVISTNYKTLVISSDPITLSVQRSTVMGYYQ